jgi:hypothetical protein
MAASITSRPDASDVTLDNASLNNVVSEVLNKGTGMEVSTLLGLHQPGDHALWRDDPTQTDAGGKGFGKRTQVDDIFFVHGHERRNVLTLETKLAIRVIFDDERIILGC